MMGPSSVKKGYIFQKKEINLSKNVYMVCLIYIIQEDL